MERRGSFLPVFLAVAFLSVLLLVFSGKLKFLSFLEKPTSAIQSLTYNFFQKLPFVAEDLKIKRLKEENLSLLGQVADFERLKRENAALLDQFQTSYPSSYNLLKAKIIAAPSFIPGVSNPSVLILNKGSKDNLKAGQAVVFKNNLVGIISQVWTNLSKVNTISDPSLSFTAKTQGGALGVAKGGADLILDNVLLSENIKENEPVLTYGEIDFEGVYVPPDLIVGKVASVEKNASDLFQRAKIESFIDFPKLSTVFIYLNTK